MNRFYGYKHWTLEEFPRCFNVGKGIAGREKSRRSRNHKWCAIVRHYGLQVEVCIGPISNVEACVWEINQIQVEKTFSTSHVHDDPSDIGCNFTRGGEGSSGCRPSTETRLKMSQSHIGNDGGRLALLNRPKTKAHCLAIQAALKGNPRVIAALYGNKHTLGRRVPKEEIERRVASLRLTNARKRFLKLLNAMTT